MTNRKSRSRFVVVAFLSRFIFAFACFGSVLFTLFSNFLLRPLHFMSALRVLMRISITSIKSFIFFIHLELDSRSFVHSLHQSVVECIWKKKNNRKIRVYVRSLARYAFHRQYVHMKYRAVYHVLTSNAFWHRTRRNYLQYLRFNSNWFIYNALVDTKIARIPACIQYYQCVFKEPRLFFPLLPFTLRL